MKLDIAYEVPSVAQSDIDAISAMIGRLGTIVTTSMKKDFSASKTAVEHVVRISPSSSVAMQAELVTPVLVGPVEKVKAKKKPGPKSVPVGAMKSNETHSHILEALRNGPLDAETIWQIAVAIFGNDAAVLTKNTHSWGLVELQNKGCKRGKQPKTGPIVKLDDGRYILREML